MQEHGTMVETHAKVVAKEQGNMNLGHLMHHTEVSERDVKLYSTKSVVKLAMFVEKLRRINLKLSTPCTYLL